MSDNLDIFFQSAVKIVKEAGQLVKEQISNRSKSIEIKSCNLDLVTETDQAVENLLIKNLSEEFPDHKFIGEESTANGKTLELTDDPTWIIDPIDGTMNFVHSFPHSCISLALFVNKEPAVGVIYNPMLSQLFTAQKGKGAFYNGIEMKVSDQEDLSKALLMYEFGTSSDPDRIEVNKKNINALIGNIHGFRCTGSAALDIAMVAMGGADIYFEFGIHIWDIAAAELLVTEAGGVVLDPSGGPINRLSRRIVAASSKTLALKLIEKIEQFYPTPTD